MLCSGGDHVKCLALLLDREEADLNLADSYGYTAVHWACRYGQWKSLLFLIRRGADINLEDEDGETPMDVARMFGHYSCVRTLTRYDAVGMRVEDLPPVSQALKVHMYIYYTCLYIYLYNCISMKFVLFCSYHVFYLLYVSSMNRF